MTSLLRLISSFHTSLDWERFRQAPTSSPNVSLGKSLALWTLVLGSAALLGAPQDAHAQPFGNGTVIDSAASSVQTIHAADIDGDGVTDVVSGTDSTVAWYQSNEDGSFTKQLIASANDVRSVFATDVDGDGDTDVLSASDYDQITLHVNDGSSDPSFTSQIVSADAREIQSIYAADVNEDGNTDVLSASRDDDTVAWYENDGSASFTERTITTSANGASSVYAADINGDDTTDVVFSAQYDNTVAWYDQTADSTYTITTSVNDPRNVNAADVDGDGDTDIFSDAYNGEEVQLYENDGTSNPSFSSTRVVRDYSGFFRDIHTSDINDDGDVDLLLADSGNNEITWHENDGSGSFTEKVVSSSVDGASSVSAADMDGDGDVDPLSAASFDNTIAYYENGQILEEVIYVDADATGAGTGSSWADAHTNLQDALPDSTEGGPVEIWVADGIYQPDVGEDVELGDRSASFTFRTGASIYGGFDGTDGQGGGELETQRSQRDPVLDSTGTVLSGDQGEDGFRGDDAFHVVTVVDGGTAIIDGFVVRDGLASGSSPNNSGAGIWVKYDGDLTVRNALITNNAASGSGGDGGGVRGNGTFENVTVRDNSANSRGGGMDGSGTFTDVTFRNNSAGNDGGGIDGNGTFTNVTFRNNTADGYGGGINGDGTFTNVTFRNNSAGESGGGIDGGNSTFTDVTFRDNSADGYGGGANVNGTFTNVTFRNNSASGYNGFGGGLNGSGTLTDVTFRNNSAGDSGGGMSGDGTLTDVIFRENEADHDGGGLHAFGTLELKRVTFLGNSTAEYGDGGGAYTNGSVRAANVRFLGNTSGDAGGLYIGNSGAPISNAVFSGNEAFNNGGALYIGTDSSPKVGNVTFTNNSAQSGQAIYSTGTNSFPIIVNSVLWANVDSTGQEIYVDSGQPSAGNSIIQGGVPSGVFDNGDVIDEDPLFADPLGPDSTAGTADDSLQVQAGSPAIDAGNSSELPADSLDLNDNGDTSEPLPLDLAGNARTQDVPEAGGSGDFSVDLGAYEKEGELPDELANGDVDGSGDVTPNDASLTLQGFLDLIALSPAEQRAADFNNNDTVTPFDASLILQDYLGNGSSATLAKAETGTEGTVRLGEVSAEDGTATIPVMLSGSARQVQSVALDLTFEPETASVKSVSSAVPDGWMKNHNAKGSGTLTVGLAGASSMEGERTIATVRLSLSGPASDLSAGGTYRLNGSSAQSLGGASAPTPSEFSLEHNYPNPVKRTTTIEYQLAESTPVQITVYDMLGRRIQTLVDTRQEAGQHSVKWGSRDASGSRVASGVYFYRIQAGDFTETQKMVVVR
jgi:predicted outer membrane repeat protein